MQVQSQVRLKQRLQVARQGDLVLTAVTTQLSQCRQISSHDYFVVCYECQDHIDLNVHPIIIKEAAKVEKKSCCCRLQKSS